MKVRLNIVSRWVLFALYLTALFTLPVAILGKYLGVGLGLVISATFLLLLQWKYEEKIFKKMNLQLLSAAESPELQNLVKELSRRLGLKAPRIAKLKSETLNIAAFGLRKRKTYLVLTEGLLSAANRPQLTALIGRELTAIWYGDCSLSSWFAQFLSLVESISSLPFSSQTNQRKKSHSFSQIIFQMFLVPFTLIPQHLLLGIRRSINLDLESLKLTQLPQELEESYRLLEASAARNSLRTHGSFSPLFLVPPTPVDPIAKLFFYPNLRINFKPTIEETREHT